MLAIDPVPFAVRPLVEDAIAVLAPRAQQKRVEVGCIFAPDVPDRVIGDPNCLRQVLLNLLGNAVKFTAEGQVVVRVTSSMVGEQIRLAVEISDTGVGIEADAKDRLFAPFVQADVSITRRFGGTGLGLTISKRLVELMGGEISIESVAGRGTRVEFHVLYGQVPALKSVPPSDPIPPVLVIGGSDLTRETLKAAFTKIQVHAEWMDSRPSGFEPGIVLVDSNGQLNSPYCWRTGAGWKDRWNVLPCVLLAPPEHGVDPDQLHRFGISDILFKPVRLSRLEAVLRQLPVIPTPVPVAPLPVAGKPVVLVVEDNPVNQRVASHLLDKLGCSVEVANNGLEALELIRRNSYSIIFMDCAMPMMDGFETTRVIRAEIGSAPVIVAMTAYAFSEDQKRCMEAGMNDYLTKPVTLESIRSALARWLPEGNSARAAG
jgi:CheY-like chemotaxis protein